MMEANSAIKHREPWNKGKLVGQKTPFKPKEIWAIRIRLQMDERVRELALFNLGIDSKLRACDLTALQVRDIWHGNHVATRACVLQRKTQRPVQFEITAPAREAVEAWIRAGQGFNRTISCFRAACTNLPTSAPASTPESSTGGSKTLGWIQ